MLQSIKLIILSILFIFIVSLILPGCYTQLSRPRVATEDEYYPKSEKDEVDEYYQDEGVPSRPDSSQNVYIYNYYPYWTDFDYYYNPYWRSFSWNYLGPYPDYWWHPYGHGWIPGWYVGFSYYDYWWGGYPWYYYNDYQYGDYSRGSNRTYAKQPFTRRSPRLVDRRERAVDTQTSLVKPQSPSRVERPKTTLSNPTIRDRSMVPQREKRSTKEPVTRTKRDLQPSQTKRDDAQPVAKPRSVQRKSDVIAPRPPKTHAQPKMIESAAPPKSRENSPSKSYSPERSNRNHDRNTTPSTPQMNRPSSPSYTPRSSGTSSGATSAPRSSPSSNNNRSSSSGSSKTKR